MSGPSDRRALLGYRRTDTLGTKEDVSFPYRSSCPRQWWFGLALVKVASDA
jgi:hypothetical protein